LEGYLADTWKVRPNLSLDLGIRYSYTFPNRAVNNDISTFVPSLFRPEQARQVIPTGPGTGSLRPGIGDPFNGIVIPGDGFPEGFEQTFAGANDPAIRALFKGLPRSISDNFSVFSPRVGFAYDPTGSGKFSIRGGAGMFTDILPTGFFAAGGTNPPFNAIRQVLNGRLEDPAGGNAAAEFPLNITGFLPNLEAPITYKMNLGIQRQLSFSSLLDVNYVTSQSRHNIRRVDFNLVHPAVRVANPGVNLNAIRRFPGYGSILLYESSASSNYHGLQMGLTRRYAKALTYSVAYTLSKALDDGSGNNSGVEDITNYRGERSHSDLDRNHVLMMSYVWEIPFGGRGNRWYEKVFGGWAISGINQFQTGPWLTPTIVTATGVRRPNRVGELTYLDPRQVRTLTGGDGQPRTGNFYFDPGPGGAFVAPPADRFGNSAPNVIRGPGRNNWNIALMKDFRLKGEDIKLKFRAEAFNIWNHVQFNNPNTTVSDRAFGTISSSAPGRNVQLGLKLEF
ncbi:MAG: hypothetical protein L0338_34345, partial [Acidobacteria bacterium]|nr:hypothetical protein [Acidobacteriota bacterium]